MASKTYFSKGRVVAITITLPSGATKRIKFTPTSKRGSVYTTDKVAIQEALEKSSFFGSMYQLKVTSVPTEEKVEEPIKVEPTKVEVNDIDEAKDYLAENFGIARSKMRSKASIFAIAGENNIEFVGI